MINLPRESYLHQTVRKEANGTWTAYRYVLVASVGNETKAGAVKNMREFRWPTRRGR